MANYSGLNVGNGDYFSLDLLQLPENVSDVVGWFRCADKIVWVGGYALAIGRADLVTNLQINQGWEELLNKHLAYTIQSEEDGDYLWAGGVVVADGAKLTNVTLHCGALSLNDPLAESNTTQDDRWSTTVNGLNVCGKYAVAYAYADTELSNVSVSAGALYSHSTKLNDLTVSGDGRAVLYQGSKTTSVVMSGGFVQVSAGAEASQIVISGGELLLDNKAASDEITVKNGGMLLLNAAVREVTVAAGGTVVLGNHEISIDNISISSGAHIVIKSDTFSSATSYGYNFAKDVTVGYGFGNALLGYTINNIYYQANPNEARNYIVTQEDLTMEKGQSAYQLTIDDGGSLLMQGGVVDGLTVNMNSAILRNDASAKNIVVNGPDLVDSTAYSTVGAGDNAKLSFLYSYDNSFVYTSGNAQLDNFYIYDSSEVIFSDSSKLINLTVDNCYYVIVEENASIQNVIFNSGVMELADNAKLSNATINGGDIRVASSTASVNNVTINSGATLAVQGSVSNVSIKNGARLAQVGDRQSVGAISGVTVAEGAWLSINNAAQFHASYDPSKVTIGYDFYSGHALQKNAKESYKYIVTFYSTYTVGSGYTANDMCIAAGNDYVYLNAGAKMIDGDIENGTLTVSGNAVISGIVNLYGSTYHIANNDFYRSAGIQFNDDDCNLRAATFNFVLGQNQELADYTQTTSLAGMGLNFAQEFGQGGGENYDVKLSVTVDSTLKTGEEYSMYLGTGFNMTGVQVYDKNGNSLGTVSYGQDLVAKGVTYSVRFLNSDEPNSAFDYKWGFYATVSASTKNDINGDGLADIVMQTNDYSDSGAWLLDGNGKPYWLGLSALPGSWTIFDVAEVSGDNVCDIVLYDSKNHEIGLWTMGDSSKGQWGPTAFKSLHKIGANAELVAVDDFDGDNLADFLYRGTDASLGIKYSDGSNFKASLALDWKIVGTGDIDGDGNADLVMRNGNNVGAWKMTDKGPAWSSLPTISDANEIVGLGDFNGDGTDDVLLNTNGSYGYWVMKDGSAVGWQNIYNFPTSVKVEDIADYNNDGIDDLRVRNGNDLASVLIYDNGGVEWKAYGSLPSQWNSNLAC